MKATVQTHPNIFVIKYWGKRDIPLNLPAVSSLSVTLDTFHTTTTVSTENDTDVFVINGVEQRDSAHIKIARYLDTIHPQRSKCLVISKNNFPTAVGLASCICFFSFWHMQPVWHLRRKRSIIGILCQSWPDSVLVQPVAVYGEVGYTGPKGKLSDGSDSHGIPLYDENHWDLSVIVAVVDDQKKPISSRDGMLRTQQTSPLYNGWCDSSENDISIAKEAIKIEICTPWEVSWNIQP